MREKTENETKETGEIKINFIDEKNENTEDSSGDKELP